MDFGNTIIMVTHYPVVVKIGAVVLEVQDDPNIENPRLELFAAFCKHFIGTLILVFRRQKK